MRLVLLVYVVVWLLVVSVLGYAVLHLNGLGSPIKAPTPPPNPFPIYITNPPRLVMLVSFTSEMFGLLVGWLQDVSHRQAALGVYPMLFDTSV